ncbi:hypothetical protein ACFE04_002116 [Oxalis oulophora]
MEGRSLPWPDDLFKWKLKLLVIIITIIIITADVEASIHDYKNGVFSRNSNAFIFSGGNEGLFASKVDHSADNSVKGKSFIRFDGVTFVRPKETADKQSSMQQNTGLVEAIVLEVKDRERIGGTFMKSNKVCCDKALHDRGVCKTGEVIIHQNPNNPLWPRRIKTFFTGNESEVKMDPETVEIDRTGMYYLYFVYCDPQLKGTFIKGSTVWKNPNGYLPGKMTPLMTFFGFMSLAYLVLGLLWFLRFVRYWKDIIKLHYYITVVMALGMSEMAMWYFEYANFNSTGRRPKDVTFWAVTFTSVKKTVSRLLVLIVSMGYGVVKPTLGAVTSNKVLLLGVVYFIASEGLEIFENMGNINDYSGKAKLFSVLPAAVLDAWLILWIFSALAKTLEKLQMRRNAAKLDLYRRYTNSLAGCVLLSIAWIGFELYFNATDPMSELWRIAWIIPAFWNMLSFTLLVVICMLWAPSSNPTRYAYSEEIGEDLEEEGISLTTGRSVTGDLTTKLEMKDLLADEDLEEDKRE